MLKSGSRPGRMPGRAGGQLLALDQHDVGPALLGEVIERRDADDAAADDDRACLSFHRHECLRNAVTASRARSCRDGSLADIILCGNGRSACLRQARNGPRRLVPPVAGTLARANEDDGLPI